uniref:Cation/H+ exchanger transmembrane domain-containing protein n=1 Tax=Chloropicon laureae TaxID=464258 RepID=A0A7S2Z3K7_9CHLO
MVGLLFALLPLFGGTDMDARDRFSFVFSLLASLAGFLVLCFALSRVVMPPLLHWIQRRCSLEVHRLFSIAFCFSVATFAGFVGVSEELGAFAAGAIIGSTCHASKTLENVNQMETVFVALFLGSIGIIMSPAFLARHLLWLFASFVTCVATKTTIFFAVIHSFGQTPLMTSLGIGLSLTPISEFAFVILSASYKMKMITRQWYMLFLGVCGLSMLISPFTSALLPFGKHPQRRHTNGNGRPVNAEPETLAPCGGERSHCNLTEIEVQPVVRKQTGAHTR